MPTAKQIAANRANAQKSTGPRTQEGRQKVSLNALKHGFFARFEVLSCENQDEYNQLLERFLEAEKPVDDVERELVGKMARHTWLADRALRFQDGCFVVQPQTPEQKANHKSGVAVRTDLEMYIRLHTAHDRAYERAAKQLQDRRKQRLNAENGSVSKKRAEREQERREELHVLKVATAETKLEREKTQTFLLHAAAAEQLGAFPPPEKGKLAA